MFVCISVIAAFSALLHWYVCESVCVCAYSIITRKQKFKLLFFAVDIFMKHFRSLWCTFYGRFMRKRGVYVCECWRDREGDKMTVARCGKCCQHMVVSACVSVEESKSGC